MLPQIPEPFTTIGPLSIRSFTLLLALAIAFTMAASWFITRNQGKRVVLFEITLITLSFAIAGARVNHVLLHWEYFADHSSEILQLRQGGLNWHGAIFGSWLALLGCSRWSRWRGFIQRGVLPVLPFAIPTFTLAAWRACISARCAYGREVDTLYGLPAWLADWSADTFTRIAPRYNTASLGSLLALLMFALACYQLWRRLPPVRQIASQLVILSVGMWLIGELRGDFVPVIADQRADQWLALLVFIFALTALLRDTMRAQPATTPVSTNEEAI